MRTANFRSSEGYFFTEKPARNSGRHAYMSAKRAGGNISTHRHRKGDCLEGSSWVRKSTPKETLRLYMDKALGDEKINQIRAMTTSARSEGCFPRVAHILLCKDKYSMRLRLCNFLGHIRNSKRFYRYPRKAEHNPA